MKNQSLFKKYFLLVLASFLLYFTGLRYAFFLAPWITFTFFIFYFRQRNKLYDYLMIFLLLFIPKFFIIHKGWEMSVWLELSATIFTLIPLLLAFFADKYFHKKLSSVLSTLVFPATYVIFDWLIGKASFGTFSSIAITQFSFKPLLQLASITGMEGIAFIVLWFASMVATLWESKFNFKKEKTLIRISAITIIGILILGGIFFTIGIPTGETVKVAGITVEHDIDYSNIIDVNTPKSEIEKYTKEIEELNNELFKKSEKAADFGVKIIFWSEIAGILFEENEEAFLERGKSLAKEKNVYFAPSVLRFHYDSGYAENKIIMITPEGKIDHEYEKTISWYPTKSDGIIKTIDTPYGRIGSVICFDADFSKFLRQAAKKNVDILINPKFDTQMISPGHTFSGLIRGVEGGYSMISQVNEGISIASDFRGNVLAYQDFFTTEDKTMIADLPIKGRRTLYTYLGDWFIYLNVIFLVLLTTKTIRQKERI